MNTEIYRQARWIKWQDESARWDLGFSERQYFTYKILKRLSRNKYITPENTCKLARKITWRVSGAPHQTIDALFVKKIDSPMYRADKCGLLNGGAVFLNGEDYFFDFYIYLKNRAKKIEKMKGKTRDKFENLNPIEFEILKLKLKELSQ